MEVSIMLFCVLPLVGLLVWVSLLGAEPDRGTDFTQEAALIYVPILPAILRAWETSEPNLIVIDLRTWKSCGPHKEEIPGSLCIPLAELPTLLAWTPPAAKLVFCASSDVDGLDSASAKMVLRTGIDTVYFLEGGIDAWRDFAARPSPAGSRFVYWDSRR